MAIQNFLSGGFYGSIGDLTGRRWKNKRVLSAKYKPTNPRTPAQQRQRELFTKGSALAKIAQQVNWNAPQFTSPIRTDWNQRQTVAINALKDGKSDWEALPLAPADFKASHVIGTCTLEKITDDNTMQVLFEGDALEKGKKYACAVFIQSGDRKGEIIVGIAPEPNLDALRANFRLTDASGIEGEEVYIKIASIDDTDTDTVTLSAGILLQQAAAAPYEFNPTLKSVTYTAPDQIKVAVTLGEEAIESYDAFSGIQIRLYGKTWTKETAIKNASLSESTAQAVDTALDIVRTTVAKSTATVTFVAQYESIPNIEKYAAKLDISFTANNVKGADTEENTQDLSLTAQAFHEYLQPTYDGAAVQDLYISATENKKLNGEWVLTGAAYADSAKSSAMQLLYISQDWESDGDSIDSLEEITTNAGDIYNADDIDELYEEGLLITQISGGEIGWGIEGEDIKSFKGTYESEIYFPDGKVALYGYRVLLLADSGNDDEIITLHFTNE